MFLRRPVEVSVEFIQHISEQLNSISSRLLQRPQESEADCLYYRLESVVRVLRRLAAVVSLPREDEIFNVLYSSLEHLSQADLCVNFAERGPTMTVGKEQVQFLLEQHFKVHDIARMYGVSYSSIRRWMKRYKLSVRQTYSDISSEDFKSIINNFIGQCPNSGYRIVVGHLRSLGIRWRIVVHGGIDGYSRKIMSLKANSNNKAASVLDCFLEAVHEHGLPHRVRSDKGGENMGVARFMLEHPERGPATSQEKVFITRELSGCGAMCGVICNYYSAFRHLEELSLLDPDQDLHLICLHYIMLPRLNHHLQMFTRTWDNHSLSTEGNMSPSQLWLAGHVMNSQLFLHTEDHRTLGIDWDAPVAVPDPVQEVILPEPPLALQDIINSHLSLTIDPLMNYCTDHTPMESMLHFMKMDTFIVKQESLELSEDCDSSTSSVVEVTSEGTDENCLDNLEGDVDEDNIISPVVEFTSEGMSVDGPDNLEENVDEDSINAPCKDFFVNSTLADSDDEDIRLASPVRRFSGNQHYCCCTTEKISQSACRALERSYFEWHKVPNIEFIDFLWQTSSIRSEHWKEDQETCFLPYDQQAFSQNKYYTAGKLVTWSIMHNGPGLRCLNSELFQLMCGHTPELSEFNTELIPEPEVQEKLSKLQKCNTEADFNEIKSNLGDWISEVASMVQQFKAGMNSCNLFWEKVATDWHEFLPIFTHTSVRLSRTVFRELFYVKWSAEGSNRREKEEDTMYQWECLLMSIQEGETTDITFEELLTFATGADAIPPLDFPHKCSIEFYDQEEGSCRLPFSSTCALVLYLPRGIAQEDELRDLLTFALKGSLGFGKV
ncbi:hypothetical protein E1301_Tti023046 [Triplophysa tibetana]|uniref:HECT domain-containing protein n=1 Tax=Triplophysa tibetana TaxID=1572043 RepID=A0A5A9MWY1_9TELE|nr:hypothetical protein E1301_Tti023046 [Triplophysa tibetana]